jgi:hypothetical protein
MQDMSDLRKSIAERLGSAAKSERPGAKAKMATSYESVNQLYDRVMPSIIEMNQFVSLSIPSVQSSLKETATAAKRAAAFGEKILKDRVASPEMLRELDRLVSVVKAQYGYRITQRGASFSRPGAKAKMATEVGRKGNKAAMISRDPNGGWRAWVVQRGSTGIDQYEDLIGTMRSYATEEKAKRAVIAALDTSGFSRPGAKAKFSMQFEVGKTYEHSFANDSDSRVMWKVMARSGSMLTIKQVASGYRVKTNDPSDYRHGVSAVNGETKRVKIHSDERGEYVYPMGRYSMAPSIRATDIARGFSRPGAKAKMAKWESTLTKKDGKPMEEFTATIHGEQFKIEVKEQAGKPVATLYIFYESRGFRPMGQGTLQAMMNKAQRYAEQEAKDVDAIGRSVGFWSSRPGAKGSSKAKA